MFCPLHRLPMLHGAGGTCAACEKLGLTVIECEVDKISRTVDTMCEQGYVFRPEGNQSWAVLVFQKPLDKCPECNGTGDAPNAFFSCSYCKNLDGNSTGLKIDYLDCQERRKR